MDQDKLSLKITITVETGFPYSCSIQLTVNWLAEASTLIDFISTEQTANTQHFFYWTGIKKSVSLGKHFSQKAEHNMRP